MLGVAVATRSVLGLIGTFVLFLQTEIYRAKLEEKLLARKFGEAWKGYVRRTRFIFPLPRK